MACRVSALSATKDKYDFQYSGMKPKWLRSLLYKYSRSKKGTDHHDTLQYPDTKLGESMLSFITVTPRIFQLRDDSLG